MVNQKNIKRLVALMTLPIAAAFFGGCGASDGDNVTLTGGQDPGSAEPATVDVPLFYIKRPLPLTEDNLTDPLAFSPGAQLLMREKAANDVPDIDLTARILAQVAELREIPIEELVIDIKDISVSFDAVSLVFAARVVQEPVDDNLEQTTWNLWLYDLPTDTLSFLISDPIARDEGLDRHDVSPVYLPDDSVLFTSTRQQGIRSRQLDVGRPQYAGLDEDRNQLAAVLHTLDPETQQIKQISFNQSHDLYPAVMNDGRIVFSRWENATGTDSISLYLMNPDGSELSLLYGHDSHQLDEENPDAEIEYSRAFALEDGQVASFIRPRSSTTRAGLPIAIDVDGFSDYRQPLWDNLESADLGHQPILPFDTGFDDTLTAGGKLALAVPTGDGSNRLMMSWSACQAIVDERQVPCTLAGELTDETEAAAFNYGLWLYDPSDNTQRPIILPEAGQAIVEAVLAINRDFPPIVNQAATHSAELAANQQAMLRIDSVYGVDGADVSSAGIAATSDPSNIAYQQREARFLRIVTPVPIPSEETLGDNLPGFAFGRSSAQSMREIAGYVPIEPDGSVSLVMPANTPFMLSILDANGRRVSDRHNQWLQLGAGEIRECVGCHADDSTLPHGRLGSNPPRVNPGATAQGDGTIGYVRTAIKADAVAWPDAEGDSMAALYDRLYPLETPAQAAREIALDLAFTDEWTDVTLGFGALADIQIPYDASWPTPEIPYVLIDGQPSLIRINYIDHIQPIWERERDISNPDGTDVLDAAGEVVTSCVGCHAPGQTESGISAGQLDLTSVPSDQNPNHVTSYRELLFTDTEQWLVGALVIDRTRICSREVTNDQGELVDEPFNDPNPPRVPPVMSVSGANFGQSPVFFACFESGNLECGNFTQQTEPPEGCEETGTLVTDEPFDHNGMLTDAELRLISEWLDIGGQYFNDPFHPVLLDSL